jgi:hypothetical protein
VSNYVPPANKATKNPKKLSGATHLASRRAGLNGKQTREPIKVAIKIAQMKDAKFAKLSIIEGPLQGDAVGFAISRSAEFLPDFAYAAITFELFNPALARSTPTVTKSSSKIGLAASFGVVR